MHITVSHSHSHRLFLSTIFASNFPHASCIYIFPFAHLHFVLFSAVFGFWFFCSRFSFYDLGLDAVVRFVYCFSIVHTKVYFYSMMSPHANVLNSLSCAIRLSSLSISNYWCFHWLLARNVNVLLLSISAFYFCWFCWSCGIVHISSLLRVKMNGLYWNLVL